MITGGWRAGALFTGAAHQNPDGSVPSAKPFKLEQ
jgi:hypothetical protein